MSARGSPVWMRQRPQLHSQDPELVLWAYHRPCGEEQGHFCHFLQILIKSCKQTDLMVLLEGRGFTGRKKRRFKMNVDC